MRVTLRSQRPVSVSLNFVYPANHFNFCIAIIKFHEQLTSVNDLCTCTLILPLRELEYNLCDLYRTQLFSNTFLFGGRDRGGGGHLSAGGALDLLTSRLLIGTSERKGSRERATNRGPYLNPTKRTFKKVLAGIKRTRRLF